MEKTKVLLSKKLFTSLFVSSLRSLNPSRKKFEFFLCPPPPFDLSSIFFFFVRLFCSTSEWERHRSIGNIIIHHFIARSFLLSLSLVAEEEDDDEDKRDHRHVREGLCEKKKKKKKKKKTLLSLFSFKHLIYSGVQKRSPKV